MSSDEVTFVLDAIKNNWSAGTFSEIPLERIDRDESDLLDSNRRQHSFELEENNAVGASLVSRTRTPIGTEYDNQLETVVGVRVEGVHKSEYGKLDPDASMPPASAGDPVPFEELVFEIQEAIYDVRFEPSAGRSGVDYTHLVIQNDDNQSAQYTDYYRYNFEVQFDGFETLP